MAHAHRSSESVPSTDFLTDYPRCVLILESAIRETVTHHWDDYSRKRALDIAQALLDGCRVCGFREDTGILRSVIALLMIPDDEAPALLPALSVKFEDLLRLLRQQARVESA